MYSYEVNKLISEKIYRKTLWFRKYGNGWFDFVLKINHSKFIQTFICEFGTIYLSANNCTSSESVHITVLIIKKQELNNKKIKEKVSSENFCSIYKKKQS